MLFTNDGISVTILIPMKISFQLHLLPFTLLFLITCFPVCSDWLDLWFSYWGYLNGVQDAMPGMEISLLHALKACIQRISTNQSFWSFAPSSSMGPWISWNFLQQTLPPLVWFCRGSPQMAAETGLHKHHCLPLYIPSSCCILYFACNLPSHRKIHHTNGNLLISIFI